MKRIIRKKAKRIVSFLVVVAMIATSFLATPMLTESVNADNAYPNSPIIEDGVATWNCVYFGSYHYESETDKHPIKWRILEETADDYLLLSDTNIENRIYAASINNRKWENSDLRQWLNSVFYNEAFNADEQKIIKTTNNRNTYADRVPSASTEYKDIKFTQDDYTFEDNVFILTLEEAFNENYGFSTSASSNSRRASVNTDYIRESKTVTSENHSPWDNCGIWWLRTSFTVSSANKATSRVNHNGELLGKAVYDKNACVRPAIRVKKNSSLLTAAGTVSSNGEIAQPADGAISWSFDSKNGRLAIYGSGPIPNYTAGSEPWSSVAKDVERITMSEKITSIGAYAFESCEKLEYVYIPDSVTSIHEKAFYHSNQNLFVSVSSNTSVDKNKINCTSIRSKKWPIEVKRIDAPKLEADSVYTVQWYAPEVNGESLTGIKYKVYLDGDLYNTYNSPQEIRFTNLDSSVDHKIQITTLIAGSRTNHEVESNGKSVRTSLNGMSGAYYDDNHWTTWQRVYYGRYLQESDGKGWFKTQPIQWRILDVDDQGYAILLADKNLDCQKFHSTATSGITWMKSDIREWLNNDFLYSAFTDDEIDQIELTDTSTEDTKVSPSENTHGKDKVFLLSQNDVTNPDFGFHFRVGDADSERIARNTDYNLNYRNIELISGDGMNQREYCNWWLRTVRKDYPTYSFRVDYNGTANQGREFTATHVGVRPAIRIKLSATDLTDAGSASASQTEVKEEREEIKYTVRIDGKRYITLKAGSDFTFPEEYAGNEKDGFIDYNSDGREIHQPGSTLKNINSNKNFVSIEASVETNERASVYLSTDDEIGIQFYSTARINGSHEIRSSSLEYGTLITTEDKLNAYYGGDYNNLVIDEKIDQGYAINQNCTDENAKWKDGAAGKELGEYLAQILGTKDEINVNDKYVVRGYLVIKYSNGNRRVVYSNVDHRVQSIRDICVKIKNNPERYNRYVEQGLAEVIDEIVAKEQ